MVKVIFVVLLLLIEENLQKVKDGWPATDRAARWGATPPPMAELRG